MAVIDELAQSAVWHVRRWTPDTLQQLNVGFDGERFTIPIGHLDGTPGHVERYVPPGMRGNGDRKLLAPAGAHRDLFPAPETLHGSYVFLVEGAPAAITVHSAGLEAISVPSATGWQPDWAARFAGRDIIVTPDADPQGRAGFQRIAEDLLEHALTVRIYDPYPDRDDGSDIGDLIADLVPAENPDRIRQVGAELLLAALDRPVLSHVPAPLREWDVGHPLSHGQWDAGRDVGHHLFSTRPVDLAKLRPVRFMWRPWLIHGRLNLFVGEEASGKSTLQAWLASQITRGKLPGERENNPGHVLYVGADEDDWYEIVTPRLHAMNADLTRIHEFVPVQDTAIFNVVDHIAELDRELQAHPFSLVVFEQLMDVLPKMGNPNDPVEIRRVLRPLRRVLAAREVTGLGTLHVNKAMANQLRQRMQGSMQFGALSRSTILIDRHPEDEDRRVAVLGKANYVAKPVAISFRIDSHPFLLNNAQFDVGRVADVQEDDATLADVLDRASSNEREREHDERLDAVAGALDQTPQSVRDIAVKTGIPRSTTDRLLKELAEDGGVERTPDGWVSHVPLPLRDRDAGQAGEQARLDDYRRVRDRMLGEHDD